LNILTNRLPTKKVEHFEEDSDNSGITQIKESTEMGEVVREINSDKIDGSRMSQIDMKARLHYIEISGILCIDFLVNTNFLPDNCLGFTRQKKRLSVSLDGEGRNDIVKIITGNTENKKGMLTFADRVGKFFGGNRENGSP
jgi:hypothetical protein